MFKLLSILLSFVNISTAFTNGTLLPSYLCGLQNDGYPKSVGTLIPYLKFQQDRNVLNFPQQTGHRFFYINN